MQNEEGRTLKAGIILIKPNTDTREVLLIFRHKEQDWSFPKGHIEVGETPLAAAVRETTEETGLVASNLIALPDHQYTSTHEFNLIRCSMFYTSQFTGTLTPEIVNDRAEWYPEPEIVGRLTDEHWKMYYTSISPLLIGI